MQVPVNEQWWSYLDTHFPHFLQWWLLKGKLVILHTWQDSLYNNSDFGIIKGDPDNDIFLISLLLIIDVSIGKFSFEFFSINPGFFLFLIKNKKNMNKKIGGKNGKLKKNLDKNYR